MAVSRYLRKGVGTEQRLYENIIIESIQHYGLNVFYLPRTVNGLDKILNEDAESMFNEAWQLEMYPESIQGFEGQGDLMAKFGLEIRDEITLVVAKRTWEKWVGQNTRREGVRPEEGDIIYLPWCHKYFDITFVEHEQPFYALMNLPTYKLTCSLFELSSEKFNTGNKEIDRISRENAQRTKMMIENVQGPGFMKGERVHQVLSVDPFIGVNGELVGWNRVTNEIELIDISVSDSGTQEDSYSELYMFQDGLPISGNTTGTIANIVELYDLDSDVDNVMSEDDGDKNWEYELFADNIIDFSETNPFGEP